MTQNNKECCITCGVHEGEMKESPWARYIKNATTGKHEFQIQCKPCRENEIEKQIADFQKSKFDTEYTNDIFCPHCGHQHSKGGSDSEVFYQDGTHDFTCDNCQNEFEVITSVSFSYSTYKHSDAELAISEEYEHNERCYMCFGTGIYKWYNDFTDEHHEECCNKCSGTGKIKKEPLPF